MPEGAGGGYPLWCILEVCYPKIFWLLIWPYNIKPKTYKMKQKNIKCLFPLIALGLVFAFATSCGNDGTPPDSTDLLPVLTTTTQSNVAQTTATCGGDITSDGGSVVTVRGVCFGTTAAPTIADSKTTDGTGIGIFTSSITGLIANTTYFVRAYATNINGTGYGTEVSFKTLESSGGGDITYGNMTDSEGNSYKTVIIGTQTWMAENLRVTKYNDGTAILLVEDQAAWASLKTPGYCWYNNDAAANKSTNGGLYNWYAVNTGKLAPAGWHVPSNTEWQTLISYMQGKDAADKRYSLNITSLADVAKAMSLTTGWAASYVAGAPGNADFPTYVNKSGFSAIPSGTRCNLGVLGFSDISYTSFWWTSVDLGVGAGVESMAWGYYITYNKSATLLTTPNKFWGISVRCVKDN